MKNALLYNVLNNETMQCYLCAHKCVISTGKSGLCNQRHCNDSKLFTNAYGNVVASAIDPVEKKPLYHFLPGSKTFSIAVPGCNFKCGFCQNWEISQVSNLECNGRQCVPMEPVDIVENAIRFKCSSIAFTYTEPVIFFEYALEIAKIAHERGLKTIFVSNGYMTKDAIDMITPFLDACNIDLKAFTEHFYKNNCKSSLQPVLDSIKNIFSNGIHIEITTLLIPEENDSDEEIRDIAKYIHSVDPDIPWHVSRFFPRYKFTKYSATPEKTILEALKIGYDAGLRYVYGGNISGNSDTFCYYCKNSLISRNGYLIDNVMINSGKCPVCDSKIYGVWD